MAHKNVPYQCKDCKYYWNKGVKEGGCNRWCCRFGRPTYNAIGMCKERTKKTRGY